MTKKRLAGNRLGGLKNRANLIDAAAALRLREGWKYVAIERSLRQAKRKFQFEYAVKKWVFDLALLDTKTLVEFDGPYHSGKAQLLVDREKDRDATKMGFRVIRLRVTTEGVYHQKLVEAL